MSFRHRVTAVALLALLIPLAGLYWWSQTRMEELLLRRAASSLEAGARMSTGALGDRPLNDATADRLGRSEGLRVTLIGPDGTVLGDSEIPARRLDEVENHADRPEVRAALEGRTGRATRASETLALPYLYVAVPHPGGVVRVAVSLEGIVEPANRAGRMLLAAGAAGLLLVLAASSLLQRFVGRPFRSLEDDVDAVAEGELTLRHREPGDGMEADLARSIDRLADRLETVERERSRERSLVRALDRLDDGLAVVDASGGIRHANRAFREWVGRSEVEGERLDSLFRAPGITEAVERGLCGASARRELELGERTALVRVRPHGDGALVLLRDLTRLRRMEGVRRDFVANVSHELKTPLTSVVGYAEPLADRELSRDRVVEFAERILENGRRMRRLVDDLLDLSRIEDGRWEPEPEPVRVAPVARTAWRELEPAMDREIGLEQGEDATVRADPEALHQILLNLLENAARYAPEGSDVRVRCRPSEGRVRVEVTDAGPGIPGAHRERIFERFYRVDAGRSRTEGGTGLGLSIVKHLTAAHGGEVGVESEVGHGTTVWLTLSAG